MQTNHTTSPSATDSNRLREVVRFGIVGAVATLLQYGLYVLLNRLVHPTLANTIAYALSFAFNYVASTHYTFQVNVSYCRLTSWRDNNGTSRLTIPYFNTEGKLVGIQNRNLANGEKRFPSGARCSIYNLQIINLLKPGDELWITEGASDCWAMLSSKRYAIAIPSATLLTHESKETLRELHSSLPVTWHMYPDNDLAGERLYLQLREILPTLERHPLPQGCKDYSLYYLQLVKQQP